MDARRRPARANPSGIAAMRSSETARRQPATTSATVPTLQPRPAAGLAIPATTTPADIAPASTNRRAALDGRCSTSDGDVGRERIELLLSDPGDLHQVLDGSERAVLVAVVDDLLREDGSYAGQVLEVGLGRVVDVDLCPRFLSRATSSSGQRLAFPRHDDLLAGHQRSREADRLRLAS